MISKAVDLLQNARRQGINISIDKGELQLKFSKGTKIDPVLIQEIKDNKNIITDFLNNGNWKSKKVEAFENELRAFDRKDNTDIPLSFSQERLWFIDQLEGSVRYHLPAVLRLNGTLNIEALSFALKTIVSRHQVLRSVITEKEGQGYQDVLDQDNWNLEIVDGAAYNDPALFEYTKQLINKPFNLSKDYVLRASLIVLSEREHVLVVTIHHIASDGWSMSILVKELVELYDSYVSNRPADLPALELQYADYAIWQRRYLDGANLESKLQYWKQKLQGVTPLQLNGDYVRPTLQGNAGALESFTIDKDLSNRLQLLSQKQGATLFMTLLAAFKVLLYRYSGQPDICVGTPIANRTQQELEGLIGFFVNTLALRTEVATNQSFINLLQKVKTTTLEAYEHQEVPFEKVVETVIKQRDISRNPIFQVMFVLRNTPDVPELKLGEISFSGKGNEHTTSLFDITFNVSETPGGLQCSFEYATDLFSDATIKRLIFHFKQLLSSIVAAPDQRIGLLPILTQPEERQLLRDFNNTATDYTKLKTTVDLFEEQVAKTPGAIALVYQDEQLTYQELNERSNQLAHYLQNKGVKQETLVPICIENSIEMLTGILGILKSGGVYVPIDPDYPADRIHFILQDTNASILVTGTAAKAKLPNVKSVELIDINSDWKKISAQPLDRPAANIQPHHLAYIIYTSGSTGTPKGVMVEHGSMVNYLTNTKTNYINEREDTTGTFIYLTYTFDASLTGLFMPLLAGKKMVIGSKQSVEVFEDPNFQKYAPYDFLKVTPAHLQLLQPLVTRESKSRVTNKLVIGGEALHASHFEHFRREDWDVEVINEYGPTEATVGCSTYSFYAISDSDKIKHTVSIGKPIDNTYIYLLDADNQLVPIGVTGELHIGGDGLARGYLNKPELTTERFIKDPFNQEAGSRLYKTGDLARWLPDGNIEYMGRIDDQVKIRGYRIELGEIENVLTQSGLVNQAVVIAKEANGNKQLVAYVVTDGEFNKQAVIKDLEAKLPAYMVPALWMQLESIPLTANGKIDRQALPDVDVSELLSDKYVAPANETEEKLVAVWQKLLKVERIGIHDNFFELGGHSLIAMRVVSAIRKELKVEVAIKDLFVYPTVHQLAAHLQTQRGVLLPSIEVQVRPEFIPLSFSQERLWFIDQLEGSLQYHLPIVLRLKGELDIDALTNTMQTIVNRHEVLRTVVRQHDGQSYQLILPENQFKISVNNSYTYNQDIEGLQNYVEQLLTKPFDLSSDHMLRASLIAVNDKEHVFVVTMHHIASDGWSVSILVKEVVELYSSYIENRPADLQALPIQYADYAIWQHKFLQGDVLDNKLKYWKQKLQGVEPLQLPTDFGRQIVASNSGAIASFAIDGRLSDKITSLSRQQGATVFMTLLAAFKILLSKYSGQQDICIGTPTAGRQQQELEGLIGFFINTLALRSVVDNKASFKDLLSTVKTTTLEAYEHQDIAFEKVVDAVVVQRDLSRTPLFQVMFVLQNTPDVPHLKLGELELVPEASKQVSVKFELTLSIRETKSGLSGTIEYNTDLYQRETIDRIIFHFKQLLSSIVAAPDQRIGLLPILTQPEEHQLLRDFNNTATDYTKLKTTVDLFEEQVAKTPGAIALVYQDEQLTYQELNERSNQLAHYLQNKGVKQETLVPICIENSIEMLTGILGILKSGGVYVPIDPDYPADRIHFILQDTNASVLVTGTAAKAKLSDVKSVELIDINSDWKKISAQPLDRPAANIQPHHLAYIIYTSGSTGTPKGVMVEHGSMVNYLTNTKTNYINEREDTTGTFIYLTYTFDASLTGLFMPLLAGKKMVIGLKQSVEVFEDPNFQKYAPYDFLKVTPAHLQLLQPLVTRENKSRVTNKLVIGGEALHASHFEHFRKENWDVEVINEYGPTEATVGCSTYSFYAISDSDKIKHTVSIGKPIDNTHIYLLDADNQLVPIGVMGELHIGGDGLARGYLNKPELTRERFIKDPFNKEAGSRLYKTGDLARWLPDGNIEYLGRIDDQVKIRGYRIELGEIESVLTQSGLVNQAVVIAKEANGNKQLVAYVVTDSEFDKQALTKDLEAKLPAYMVPALWMQLESIPLTANGKIDRQALPDVDVSELLSDKYVAPKTEIQKDLSIIWQQLLGLKEVGIHDNFFELGGDSILTIQVVSRAGRLGYELRPKDIFIHQTIARLASVVAERSGSMVVGEQEELTGLSGLLPIQQWYLQEAQTEVSHFNQSILLGIDKAVTAAVLATVVDKVVSQHDALRFKYYQSQGQWQQEYTLNKSALIVEDLSSVTKDLIALSITKYADKHQRSLDIEKGELAKFVLLQTPQTEASNRLLIVIHHLAIDGVSWRVLLEDLELLLTAVANGEPTVIGSKSSSYRQWYNALEKYGKSQRILLQKEYWDNAVKSYNPLPVDITLNNGLRAKDTANFSHRLSAEATKNLLQEVPRVYHTEINDILLAGLVKTISNWSSNDKVIIGLEGHGRENIAEDIDTSRTVGWFTNLYPVLLKVESYNEDALIKTVKEQLRQVPDKGIGYGVLKYINREESLQGKDPWEIVFNYLGQTDNIVTDTKWFSGAAESAGATRSEEYLVSEKLSINCIIRSGQLSINWTYSSKHYNEETIQKLAQDYTTNLEGLIAHCIQQEKIEGSIFTPSDYGLGNEITYQQLDQFLNEPFRGKPRKEQVESIYRLSGLQQGMLFHSLYKEESVAYTEQFVCDLTGANIEALKESWARVIAHHSVLRSAFYYDQFSVPVQCVYKQVALPIMVLDYQSMSSEEQIAAINQYQAEDQAKRFDLKEAPLMRLSLIKLSSDSYRMIWTSHHILFDGWSLPILIEELLSNYESITSGKGVAIQNEDRYEDYIRYIERQDNEHEEAYWRNYMQGVEESTLLPFIAPMAERTKGGASYKTISLQIDADKTSVIQNYAHKHRLTINTVMQGVWACLLHHYTNSNNVVYGVIVSGRPDDLPNVEQRIGLYINTLPLHSQLSDDPAMTAWLQRLQDDQVASRQYQYTPLSEVQKWAGVQGDLFDTLLIFENYPVSKVVGAKQWGLKVENVKMHEQTNYPLTLMIGSAEKININFEFNNSLLDEVYVKNIADHFENVLLQLTENAAAKFSDIEVLTKAEKHQLLHTFNDTKTNYPHTTVIEQFQQQAAKTPEAVAVIFEDEQLTYQQLNEKSNQLAHYLQTKGVKEETLVPICIERSTGMIIGLLGILKACAAYVPIDPEYPEDRIAYMLADTAAAVAVSSKQSRAKLSSSPGINIVDLDAEWSTISTYPTTNPVSSITPGHLAYVIYTSGSTGKPKGVMIEHYSLTNLLFSITDKVGFSPCSSFLSVTTYSFDICYLELYTPLINGGRLIVVSRDVAIDGFKLSAELERTNPTHMQGTPSTWQLLLDSGWNNAEKIKILVGGEAVKETLKNDLTPLGDVYNVYGPTETTIWSAIKKLDKTEKVVIGNPLANTDLYVIDNSFQLATIGSIGEVYIGGAGLARGYLHMPDLTAEKFIQNLFSQQAGSRIYKTGDLGRWLPNGDLEYISRADDQVKIRGYRIELGEIESVMMQSGLLTEAVVVAKNDKEGNKRLVGYVLSETVFDSEDIIVYLKNRLPEYMVPALFVQLQSLPLTPNGKIDKKALPEPDIDALFKDQYVAPRNQFELTLAGIWKQLLKVERVGIHDNFFALGGHSLLAMQIISLIRQKIKVELSIRDLFMHSSISELSARLQEHEQNHLLPLIERLPRPQFIPLSFSQERLWFIDQLGGSVQYNLPTVLRLKGFLDKNALAHALKTIVRRHEVLRTVFLDNQGKAYQHIRDAENWQLNIVDGHAYNDEKALQQHIRQIINEPFNLSKDYMLRAQLIELEDQQHVLVVVMHHIASDAWSLPIIVEEVSTLYGSYINKVHDNLKPLELQYADYAIWQRNYLTEQVLDEKVNYWKAKLEDIAPLQLPADFSRSAVQSRDGGSLSFKVEKVLAEQIYELGHKQESTLFMTLLTAFKVLLYRYSGQADFSVGTSIANRSQHEVDGLIGFFVNTLAFRDEVKDDVLFVDLLRSVKVTTLEAYEHQEVPFEKVVEAVVKDRDASVSPVFQVMLVLGNTPQVPNLNLSELTLAAENYDHSVSKFDLTLFVSEGPDGLNCLVQYRTDLFQSGTISRMMLHFTQLLASIVKDPLQKVGKLPMLGHEEQQKLLDFNNNKVSYPTDATITSLFEAQVQKTPDAPALVFEGEALTYQQLNAKANRLAHYLRQRGVKEDTLVPVFIERGLELMTAILGILKSGAGYVPIDTDFPEDRISFMLKDSGSSIVISSKESRSKLETAEPDADIIVISGEAFKDQPATNPQTALQPHHLAYVIYTSGSTGKPKGVMIEHRNLVDYVFGLNEKIQVDQSQSYALVSSIATDLGNTVIYSSLVFGGALHLFSKQQVSNIEYLHEYFNENRIDCLKIVPSHWKALSLDGELLLPKKLLVFGGEALQSDVVENIWQTGSSCQVINHYGPTETTIGKLLHVTKRGGTYNATIPIGQPFSNTKVYVLSKEFQLVPTGVAGQLYIAGHGVARGYLNNEELTKTRFIQNPFAEGLMYGTGDLVKSLPDGNIEFIGRADDQVKIRGYRVEIGEIESILQQSELVSQAVVLAKQDKQGNTRLTGYVVPAEGWFNREGILSYLKEKLPEYMVPAMLVELESLPLLANGKVDRKALPDPDATEAIGDQYVAPRNDAELRLATIWQDILEVDQVGVHDDFFELGGHSLLAVRLISAIRKEFVVEIPISHVFDYPTVSLLAAELAGSDTEVLPSIQAIHPRPETIPLSFSQERLWFIDKLEGSVQYHVPTVLRLKGDLNIAALEQALKTIVNRHEVLRTVFVEQDGQAHQLIKDKDQWVLLITDGSKYSEDEDALQQHVKQAIKKPFNLAQDDMLRGELISVAPNDHVLVVTLHHIASDGWSKSILVEELAELYAAFTENRPVTLEALPVQYADFALWQRKYLQGDLFDEKLGYWKEKLENVSPLALPTDFVRPAAQSTRGRWTSFHVDKKLLEQLQQLSQQHATTMFMTMLAAFNVLMYRYSGQNDIAIGTGTAGRPQKELENLIGFFINTIVLRNEVKGADSFTDLLQQVKTTTLEAFKNEEVPFEKVVEALIIDRDLSRTPLFQVMFVFRNTPEIPELSFGNTQLSLSNYEHTTSMFDLTFYVTENPKGLHIGIEYCSDLFKPETINSMGQHFEELLKSIVKKPDEKLGKLSVLTPSEKQKLLVEFNDTYVDFDNSRSIVELFEEQVRKTPENVALVVDNKTISYKQLDELSDQLAYLLVTKGVKQQTLVPICLERSLEMIVGLLGILKSGGAYVPIDPGYPEDRISYMIKDTGASIVITSQDIRLDLETIENVIRLDEKFEILEGLSKQNGGIKVTSDDLAYVIYTSGSTGTPKGVMVTHSSVANLVNWHVQEYEVTSLSRTTAMAGVGFDAFGWEVWPYLLTGASVYIVDNDKRLLISELVEFFAAEKITHSFISTALAADFINTAQDQIQSLKYLLTGGDKLSALDLSKMNYTLVNNYGPTENTVVATSYKLAEADGIVTPPIGAPISNTKIYITTTELELAPVGVFGEICIAGQSLAKGYLNMPVLTDEKFVDNAFDETKSSKIYKTGDLGRWLANGQIEYGGRKDDQIKIRGHRVEIGEIENVVLQSGLVKQVLIILKESGTGKTLVGYVVADEFFSKESLLETLQKKLPNYMIPNVWINLESFPLTANGKIDRKALPRPEINGELKGYVAPVNKLEEDLVEIWRSLLNVERIGTEDNFFELGGHSLLAMRLVAAIEKNWSITIPITILFQFTTIKDFSKYMELQLAPLATDGNTTTFELLDV